LNKNVVVYDDLSSEIVVYDLSSEIVNEIVNDVFCDLLIEIGNNAFVVVHDLLK
jgi:hypothetical protein